MPQLGFSRVKYPWTTQYFDMHFPTIPSAKPAVFRAFGEVTGLEDRKLRPIFERARFPPEVVIRARSGYYAYCPPSGDTIELGQTFADEMEKALGLNKYPASPETTHGPYAPTELMEKLYLILEANVLHEMVHYFRRTTHDHAAIRYRSATGRGAEELIAQEFEKLAYKIRPSARTLRLEKYLPETAREIRW